MCLVIIAENKEALANVRGIVEREIKKFTESKKPLIKIWPQKTISSVTKQQRKHGKFVPQRVTPTVRSRNVRHSKHVNQSSRLHKRFWNNIKNVWKQWYINRWKINAKFKAVNQYFGELGRRRHCEVPLYEQAKRSRIEYHKQEVLGRKRDRSKAKYARWTKRENKSKTKSHKNKSKYERMSDKYEGSTPQTPKLKFITEDSFRTQTVGSKKKTKSYKFFIGRKRL